MIRSAQPFSPALSAASPAMAGVALQPRQRYARPPGGDLHQHRARAAARLHHPLAGQGGAGGGQQGGVHAGPIAARWLAQADAPVQQGVFGHVDLFGCGVHAS